MLNLKISIVIPAYNRALTIGRTIDSFLAQDYDEWELLIVDDYSTDNTNDVIHEYEKKDNRIHYLLNERKKGAQGARNTGILHSQSEWIIIFDSDDYAYPSFLRKMKEHIQTGDNVIVCYLNLIDLTRNSSSIAKWAKNGYIEKDLMEGHIYIGFDAGMFRKSALEQIGLLDEDCPSYQEFDTHLRLSRYFLYKAVEEPLVDYYLGNQDSISVSSKNKIGRCYILWKNRKRWRRISYKSFIKSARLNFVEVSSFWKLKLLQIAPEIIFIIPLMYLKRFIEKIIK